jgi:DNA-binding transcriptional ArsR family regulator
MTESELHVDDPAVVAALYDPLRYRLFRLLDTPRSVGEMADEIGVPANRLYYHVRRLVECGLVHQVDTRESGRHTEKVYGRVAERIRFSGELDLDAGAGGLIRGIADELEEAMRANGDDESPSVLSYHVVSLAPARAAELEERLHALVSEYESEHSSEPDARRYGLMGALIPLAQPTEPDGDS